MDAFSGLFGELGRQVRIRFPKKLKEAVTFAISMQDIERWPSDKINHHRDRPFNNHFSDHFSAHTPFERQNTQTMRPHQHSKHNLFPRQPNFSQTATIVLTSDHVDLITQIHDSLIKNAIFLDSSGTLRASAGQNSLSQPTPIQTQSCNRYGHTAANSRSRLSPINLSKNQPSVPSNSNGDINTATGTPRPN